MTDRRRLVTALGLGAGLGFGHYRNGCLYLHR